MLAATSPSPGVDPNRIYPLRYKEPYPWTGYKPTYMLLLPQGHDFVETTAECDSLPQSVSRISVALGVHYVQGGGVGGAVRGSAESLATSSRLTGRIGYLWNMMTEASTLTFKSLIYDYNTDTIVQHRTSRWADEKGSWLWPWPSLVSLLLVTCGEAHCWCPRYRIDVVVKNTTAITIKKHHFKWMAFTIINVGSEPGRT